MNSAEGLGILFAAVAAVLGSHVIENVSRNRNAKVDHEPIDMPARDLTDFELP